MPSIDVDSPLGSRGKLLQFPSRGSFKIDIPDNESDLLDSAGVEIEKPEDQQEDDEPTVDISVQDFDGNLAQELSEDEIHEIETDLVDAIKEDQLSREDWEKIYKESLKFLGLKEEERTVPWANACGVVFPGMLEAIVRFQSRAMVKLYGQGPATISVDSQLNPQIQLAVEAAKKKLNKYLVDTVKEDRTELDRMLFSLADIGYAAKKWYYHNGLDRVYTCYVKAEDFVMPYGCDNLETCPRFTEIVPRTNQEIDDLMRIGQYLKVDLDGSEEEINDVEEEKTKLTGQSPSHILHDRKRFYEVYTDRRIEKDDHKDANDKPSPYIIVIEQKSQKLVQVKRNWLKDDKTRKKLNYFTPYCYVPSDGSYGYGLVQLTFQLISTVTKLLRQLIDSGSLKNLPAGFKLKSARITSQEPLSPGEFRDVEGGFDDIKKAFMDLPFKGPDQVLFQFVELLIAETKSFASTADLEISAASQNAPVGTTLALIERNTEIQNAVQLRLYASRRNEFSLLVYLLKKYQEDVYNAIFGQLDQMGAEWTVVPIGDPTSATMSQRVIALQAVAQMAQQFPQAFDLQALLRTLITALGIQDVNVLVPDKGQAPPMDPVEENMSFMTGKPVQVFPYQDHQAHNAVHGALLNDPMYIQMFSQSPNAQQMVGQIMAHMAEHAAFDYRQQIEKQMGVQLPPVGQPQPPQIQSVLDGLMAKAAENLRQQHAAQAQQQQNQQVAQDPVWQLEQQKLQLEAAKLQQKHQDSQSKLEQQRQSEHQKSLIELIRMKLQDEQVENKNKIDLAGQMAKQDTDTVSRVIDIGSRLLDHKEHGDKLDHEIEKHGSRVVSDQIKHHSQLAQDQVQHEQQLSQDQLQHEQQLASGQQQEQLQAEAAKEAAKNNPKPSNP